MKTPKLDLEQKVVQKVVFLSMERVHDCAPWGHYRPPPKQENRPQAKHGRTPK